MSIKMQVALFSALMGLASRADVVDVYAEDVGGLTGPQQLTNALAQVASGSTIVVHPGRYDFTDICSGLRQYAWSPDLFWTNHVEIAKPVKIVGLTNGHWADAVVFTGLFTGVAITSDVQVEISGVTFEGFCGGTWQNWDTSSCGGAVRFSRRWSEGDPNHGDATRLTNCVVRGCTSSNGGGVWGGLLVDCLVTDCRSPWMNAVGQDVRLVASTIANNVSGSDYSLQNPNGVYDCVFSNNTAVSGSALVFKGQAATMPVSNTLFVANKMTASYVTTGIVGLEDSSGKGDLRVMDCVFRGNTGTGGSICTMRSADNFIVEGCTFECNTNSVTADRRYQGAVAWCQSAGYAGTMILDRCVFRRNYSEWSVAGVNGGVVSNTLFEANESGAEGSCAIVSRGVPLTFDKCTFVNNKAKDGAGVLLGYSADDNASEMVVRNSYFGTNSTAWAGGVSYAYQNSTIKYFDCTFERNSATLSGGATFGFASASNCVFRSNTAPSGGAMYYAGVAIGCAFEGNGGSGCKGGSAARSSLANCRISGGGLWYCALLDCECRDLADNGGLWAMYGANWATNCLFTMTGDYTSTAWGYIYRDGNAIIAGYPQSGSFVNCTFANITWNWTYFMMCDDAYQSNPDFYQTFENCIFQNNKNPDGRRVNFAYYTGKATADYIKFQNCLYGTSAVLTSVEDLGGNVVSDDVKFAKDSSAPRYASAPAYSIQSQSPARDKGLTMGWMVGATDLQGVNRVCGAAVDIGCYEFHPSNKGVRIVFQ